MAEFKSCRPFDIDNDELSGKSLQQCFVLGYELCQIDALVRLGKGFSKMIHASNQDRIEAELKRQKREFRFVWLSEDKSEDWVEIMVFRGEIDGGENC